MASAWSNQHRRCVRLGWGRNTLTRKIKELGMKIDGDEDDGDEA